MTKGIFIKIKPKHKSVKRAFSNGCHFQTDTPTNHLLNTLARIQCKNKHNFKFAVFTWGDYKSYSCIFYKSSCTKKRDD